MVFLTLFGSFIEAVLVDINECNHVVTQGDGLSVGLAFPIGADDGNIETLAGGVLSPEEEIWSCEKACGKASGGADEAAT